MIRAASSLRGLDQGDYQIFALHFTWAAGMRTSLHKHKGFDLVLVRDGRLRSSTAAGSARDKASS